MLTLLSAFVFIYIGTIGLIVGKESVLR